MDQVESRKAVEVSALKSARIRDNESRGGRRKSELSAAVSERGFGHEDLFLLKTISCRQGEEGNSVNLDGLESWCEVEACWRHVCTKNIKAQRY